MKEYTYHTPVGRAAWWTVLMMFLGSVMLANNVQITNVTYTASTKVLTFDLSWENSWRDVTGEYRDGVWIFVKYAPNGSPQWLHAPVVNVNTSGGPFYGTLESDSTGTMIQRGAEGDGFASVTVILTMGNLIGPYPDFKVFGIEMVRIPEGSYYLGGPTTSTSIWKFHRGDDSQEAFHVTHSGILTYGTTANDFNSTASFGYETDIPADYPNGYDLFWCMKYKVSQEQYVGFLNTLTFEQQNTRTETDLTQLSISNQYVMTASQTSQVRNGIVADLATDTGGPIVFGCDLNENGVLNEANDGQTVVCNYVDDDDMRAYLDWAALRPMSMLEFEKVCRGPLPAVLDEMAWGSAGYTRLEPTDIVNGGTESESNTLVGSYGPAVQYPTRVGMTATDTSDRVMAGATYYGVMGFGGNATTIFIEADNLTSIGGLNFLGTLGDGVLTSDGQFTNADWDVNTTRRSPGYSYYPSPMVDLSTGSGSPGVRDDNHSMIGAR